MGILYSTTEFERDEKRHKELCADIDKLKFKIATKEENLKFLFSAENRLAALEKMLKTADIYQEFCDLLEASVKVKGSEELEEEVENFSHLQLPIVYPPEGEVEDKSN